MHWYGILKAARRIAVDGIVTSDKLAEAIGDETRIASAWLGKFYRWGYVLRVGRQNGSGRGRPRTVYQLTSWGVRFRVGMKLKEVQQELKIAANPKKKKEGGNG